MIRPGEEGAIENKEVEVNIIFVGANYDTWTTIQWDTVIINELIEGCLDHGLHLGGLYWDKACTDLVRTGVDKIPSTGCTIYVQVDPAIGFAVVNLEYINDFNSYKTYTILESENTSTISATRYEGTEVLTKLVINGTEVTLTEGEDYVLTVQSLHI